MKIGKENSHTHTHTHTQSHTHPHTHTHAPKLEVKMINITNSPYLRNCEMMDM